MRQSENMSDTLISVFVNFLLEVTQKEKVQETYQGKNNKNNSTVSLF